MSIKLDTLDANDSLANLETAINQTEQLGFELISIAKGIVGSQPANVATFRRLAPGSAPGPLVLSQESGVNSLQQQQTDLNSAETDSKQVISYAIAFVQGREANVVAYRG